MEDDGVSFTALSHNAILGAAGGAVLATELAIHQNLVHQSSLALPEQRLRFNVSQTNNRKQLFVWLTLVLAGRLKLLSTQLAA